MTLPANRLPDNEAALAMVREMIDAMPESRIQRPLYLDLNVAAETIAGKLPALDTLRDAIAAQFGAEGLRVLDLLPVVASAGVRAETERRIAHQLSDISELSQRIVAKIALLYPFAELLLRQGAFEAERLESCRGGLGYRGQYGNLLALEALIREVWPAAGEQSLVTLADLDEAKELCAAMLTAIGVREQTTAVAAAEEVLVRTGSLLLETYEAVGRRVRFLRWHEGDATSFLPSLLGAQREARRTVARTAITEGSEG